MQAMRVRSLGPDGPQVTSVGAGDISYERSAARGIDVSEAKRALYKVVDSGISLFEVADEEASERDVGEMVRALGLRDRVVVACRVPTAATALELARTVQPRVEASLRATRLDAIPLAMLPLRAGWRDMPAWPELRGTCARLVREGKVLRWGARLDEAADEFLAEDWLAALAVPFNLCERAAQSLLTQTKQLVLARRPLAGGALAGMLGPGLRLPPADDRRRTLDAATLERIAVGAARLAAFVKREPAAARSCDAARAMLERTPRLAEIEVDTLADLALRLVIDRGAIALPRLHRRQHVDAAISIITRSTSPISTPERIFSILDES
jgi:aryl-alcohol dehydrogenase-like predicted oxidoreductase